MHLTFAWVILLPLKFSLELAYDEQQRKNAVARYTLSLSTTISSDPIIPFLQNRKEDSASPNDWHLCMLRFKRVD